MNGRYVLAISLVTALGGFLFGFDTAVISGANLYIQAYFGLDELAFGFVVSSMLIGCAVGALGCGLPSARYGRKKLLMLAAILFAVSAIGSGLATTTTGFILYRMLGGLGVGAASMLSPTYIAEVSPAGVRGKMVSLNQLAIVLGVTAAFFSNYLLSALPDAVSWRWMLGVEAVPAVVFLLLLIWVPPSPRWLVSQGMTERAHGVLLRIHGPESTATVLREIVASLASSDPLPGVPAAGSFGKLWRPSVRKVTVSVILLAMFQQLTGINVIMYYAPNIFASIGVGKSGAIFQSVSIGVVMSVFTVVAIFLVDRVGRKQLLQWGALGMAVSLLLLGVSFSAERANTYLVLLLMLTFIAFFSVSAGPVIWVLISELLPNEVRSIGTGLAAFFLWTTNYLVTLTFPWLLQTFVGGSSWITFGIYAGFCFLLFLYTARYVVETKGRTLEEIRELVAAEA